MALPDELAAAIKRAVEARRDDVVRLTEALIRIDSTNPSYPGSATETDGGEALAGRLLGERCREIGMRVEWIGPDPDRQNMVAIAPGRGGRSLLLNGHLDTVPPSDPSAWSLDDPRRAERRDNAIYGLGAADMKGPLAAGWAALAALNDLGFELGGEVQLHGVVGEEAMEHELGTTAAIEGGFRADAAINLEPTSLALTTASPGYRSLAIRVSGRSTHHGNRRQAMQPGGESVGVNALEKGIWVAQGMQELERAWNESELHPWFPAGSFTIHPGTFISVGAPDLPAPVFFPAEALLEYGIWYPPGWSGEEVEDRVEGFIAEWCADDPWLSEHRPDFDWGYDWPPFETPREEPIVGSVAKAIEAVHGSPVPPPTPQNPAAVGASVDSTWIERAGIPVVTFGPGAMSVAHSPDEYVDIDELVAAAQVLALTIAAWADRPDPVESGPR